MRILLVLALSLAAAASDLEEKIASVLPTPAEQRWLEIPWQPNVMRARVESQRTGKPMFIWVMDGNVLGCT